MVSKRPFILSGFMIGVVCESARTESDAFTFANNGEDSAMDFHDHAFQERATEEALPDDALDAVWNRQLGSVQKLFFDRKGRRGNWASPAEPGLCPSNEKPSRESGAAFL